MTSTSPPHVRRAMQTGDSALTTVIRRGGSTPRPSLRAWDKTSPTISGRLKIKRARDGRVWSDSWCCRGASECLLNTDVTDTEERRRHFNKKCTPVQGDERDELILTQKGWVGGGQQIKTTGQTRGREDGLRQSGLFWSSTENFTPPTHLRPTCVRVCAFEFIIIPQIWSDSREEGRLCLLREF